MKYSNSDLIDHLIEVSNGQYLEADDIRETDGPSVRTYQRRFGSFNKAKEAAGLTTFKAGKPDNGIRGLPYYEYIKRNVDCISCGNDCPAVIQFHHINDDKETSVSHVAGNNHSSQTVYDELKKTVPVCANCHSKHHSLLSGFRINQKSSYGYPSPEKVAAMHASNQEDRKDSPEALLSASEFTVGSTTNDSVSTVLEDISFGAAQRRIAQSDDEDEGDR